MMRTLNPHAEALLEKLGKSNVARAAGVSRQAVNKWRVHGIPPQHEESLRKAFPRGGWSRYPKAIGKGVTKRVAG